MHSADYCLSCYNDSYLQLESGRCFASSCPSGSYIDAYSAGEIVTGVCRACEFPCSVCSSAQACSQCLEGYYLWQGSFCIDECPKPSAISESGAECLAQCPPGLFQIDERATNTYSCSSTCSHPYLLSLNQ